MLTCSILLSLLFALSQANVELSKESRFKFSYKLFQGVSEAMAFDPDQKLVYIVGQDTDPRGAYLRIVDVSDTTAMTNYTSILLGPENSPLKSFKPTDVAACRSGNIARLAITFDNQEAGGPGRASVYNLLTRPETTLTQLWVENVEPNPKSVEFDSRDCNLIVMANEGRRGKSNGQVRDPVGLVTQIEVDTKKDEKVYFQGDFTNVRKIIQNSSVTMAQDLEPEAVTISPSGVGYVVFQENNAIATFTLKSTATVDALGLGTKDFSASSIDVSDKDSGPNLINRNIRAFYQPGDMTSFEFNGEEYILTADEGALTNYTENEHGIDFIDFQAAADADSNKYDTNEIGQSTVNDMGVASALGQMHITSLRQGTDGYDIVNGVFTEIIGFGGRGFSIWSVSNLNQTYNSGDDFERNMAGDATYSDVFNAVCNEENVRQRPDRLLDANSPVHGPEPSSIVTGLFNGTRVVVTGSGQIGSLYVHTISADANNRPIGTYESMTRDGDDDVNWNGLYSRGRAGSPKISDMKFYETNDAAGNAQLFVLCRATGSLTAYKLIRTP